jgi:hypothetical protein
MYYIYDISRLRVKEGVCNQRYDTLFTTEVVKLNPESNLLNGVNIQLNDSTKIND